MKKRICLSIALSALLTAVACQKEDVTGTPLLEGGGVQLTFVCNGQDTKATMPGEDAYNENTLTTIDYFLYPEGQTGSNAYLHGRVAMDGRTSYNVLVNTSQLSALFAGAAAGNKCDVFIIANYPTEITSQWTNVNVLKELALNTNFNASIVQSNFVMCGQGKATIINKNQTKAAEGTITLDRAAAKISFECRLVDHVDITNNVYSNGELTGTTTTRWKPILTGIGAYLVNAYGDGKVGGEAVAGGSNLIRYTQRTLTDADNDGWYTCEPFYSYPQSWTDGAEDEPFIKLVVPWAYLNAAGVPAGQKQFYYKVPCPGLKMDANTWYHIKLDVAILGGDDFEAALWVEGRYYVVPWNTQTIVEADAEIKDARYISVPSNTYTMYNVPDLDVVITSSHDAEINLKSVYYYDFYLQRNIDYTSTALTSGWISYNDENRKFSIYHTLNNDISTNNFDSSPYIFTFEIRQSGTAEDHAYTTGDIVVTQYPAMYINELQSNKYAFINGTGNAQSSEVTAYDNNNTSLSTLPSRNSIDDSGDNTNSHMYRITVTSVAGLDYSIGDPRLWTTSHVTTLTGLGSDYMEAADINEDMIAPEFMIASSCGKTKEISYDVARTRCAAYQENGFPAGRWRVPTKAEIMFLIQLSEKNKIPTLFTPDANLAAGGYWCSSGVVYPLNSGTVEYHEYSEAITYRATNWVRCVYDTWYWGQDPIEAYKTTWGGYHTTSQPVQ